MRPWIIILGVIALALIILIWTNRDFRDRLVMHYKRAPRARLQQSQSEQLLSEIRRRMEILYRQIDTKKSQSSVDPYIYRLPEISREIRWEENRDDSETSFTLRKRKIMMCLRSRRTGELHDINLLTYVALHELAHVACPEEGHTALYLEIFQRLIQLSVDAGIYRVENYQLSPVEYCGVEVKDCDKCLFQSSKSGNSENPPEQSRDPRSTLHKQPPAPGGGKPSVVGG